MQAVLAHAGHSHGPDPALIALLVVIVVLGFAAGAGAIRRIRARRRSVTR